MKRLLAFINKKQADIHGIFFIVMGFMILFNFVWTIATMPSIVSSLLFNGSFVVLALWLLFLIYSIFWGGYKNCEATRRIVLPLIFTAIFILFSAFGIILSSKGIIWSFSYYKNFICFVCFLISGSLIAFSGTIAPKKYIQIYSWGVLAYSALFCLICFVDIIRGKIDLDANLVYFNFSNPNVAGLVMATMFAALVCAFFGMKIKWARVVLALLSLVMLFFIYETDSRNSLLACLAIAIFGFCQYFWAKRPNLRTALSTIIVISPLVFFSVYIILYLSPLDMSGIAVFGKDIGTRGPMWHEILINWNYSFFGNYYIFLQGATSTINSHCAYLSILVTCGWIPLLAFILSLLSLFVGCSKFSTDKGKMIKLAAYFGAATVAVTLGYFEGGPVSGSAGVYFICLTPLFFLNNEEGKRDPVLVHKTNLIVC